MGKNKDSKIKDIAFVIIGIIIFLLYASPYILEGLAKKEFFPEYLSESTIGNGEYPSVLSGVKDNPINEIEVSLAFLASIATIAIAIGAWTQLRALKQSSENSATTLQMDFVRHLDQQWCSKETTEIRYELWTEYRKAKKHKRGCWPDVWEKKCEKEAGIRGVQCHVMKIDTDSDSDPTLENNKKLFEHLNFLELMGSIYLYKKQKIIDDEMLKNLFAGRLHTYLKFYEKYLKSHYSDKLDDEQPYALKLLEYLDELEAEKKG